MILLFYLISSIIFGLNGQVPLEDIYYPADGVHSGKSIIIAFSQVNYQSTFDIVFPIPMGLQTTPSFYVGIYDIFWFITLSYKINILSISSSKATLQLNIVGMIIYLKISYLILDPLYFVTSSEQFVLDSPKTNTTFSITNQKNYQVILLMTFAYAELTAITVFSPVMVVDNSYSRESVSLSVRVSSQIQIEELELQMFRIQHAYIDQSYARFGVVITTASNSFHTLWDNLIYNQPLFDGYYFVGIHMIYEIAGNFFMKVMSTDKATTSCLAYLSQLINLIRFCPTTSPYYNITSFQCVASCGISEFPSTYEVCQVCDPVCLICQFEFNNCTSCAPTMLLQPINGSTSIYPHQTCGCLSQQYIDFFPTLGCYPCPKYCKKCSSSNNCSECYSGLIFNQILNECSCRGIIKIIKGSPLCISKIVKQKCSTGMLVLPLTYSCTCPSNLQLINGICI